MTPEAVAHEVDTASLLGPVAPLPPGRKWSMLRKNPLTYLVINGDESEPATFKTISSSSGTRTRSWKGY